MCKAAKIFLISDPGPKSEKVEALVPVLPYETPETIVEKFS
jgi:hypothetical protein